MSETIELAEAQEWYDYTDNPEPIESTVQAVEAALERSETVLAFIREKVLTLEGGNPSNPDDQVKIIEQFDLTSKQYSDLVVSTVQSKNFRPLSEGQPSGLLTMYDLDHNLLAYVFDDHPLYDWILPQMESDTTNSVAEMYLTDAQTLADRYPGRETIGRIDYISVLDDPANDQSIIDRIRISIAPPVSGDVISRSFWIEPARCRVSATITAANDDGRVETRLASATQAELEIVQELLQDTV